MHHTEQQVSLGRFRAHRITPHVQGPDHRRRAAQKEQHLAKICVEESLHALQVRLAKPAGRRWEFVLAQSTSGSLRYGPYTSHLHLQPLFSLQRTAALCTTITFRCLSCPICTGCMIGPLPPSGVPHVADRPCGRSGLKEAGTGSEPSTLGTPVIWCVVQG